MVIFPQETNLDSNESKNINLVADFLIGRNSTDPRRNDFFQMSLYYTRLCGTASERSLHILCLGFPSARRSAALQVPPAAGAVGADGDRSTACRFRGQKGAPWAPSLTSKGRRKQAGFTSAAEGGMEIRSSRGGFSGALQHPAVRLSSRQGWQACWWSRSGDRLY